MEIVNIESHTWEMMMARFETFAERVEQLCRCNGDKAMQKWLDIQTYRDNGTLPFCQIGHKMYYRPQDVEQVINKTKAGIS